MGFEALLPFAPALLTGLGAGLEYAGQQGNAAAARTAGQRQAAAQQFQAAQLRVNAGQAVAAGQRDAVEMQRQSRLLQSRALALAAASGGGALDPTVVNIIGDLAGEGQYRASVALYQGEERARTMRMGAAAADFNAGLAVADAEDKAGAFERAGTAALFKAGGSLFMKYGGGGFKSASAAPITDKSIGSINDGWGPY